VRIRQGNIHGLEPERIGELRPIRCHHVGCRGQSSGATELRHYFATGQASFRPARIFGVSEDFVLVATKCNRFFERPRAVWVERDGAP